MTNLSWCALLQSDKPTWMVMSPPPKLASSRHIRGWCSLVYGQPSYMGQVYQSHPTQDYLPGRWWREDTTREQWQGGHWWPTSKASLGWKNGKLQLELWTSTGVSTEDGWRLQVKWFGCRPPEEHVCKAEGWCLYPLTLVDSEPEMLPITELGHGRQGQQTGMGGVKQASSPCVGVKGPRSTTSTLNAPTYWEVPTPNLEGWPYTLQSSQAETTEHKVMLYKIKWGVYIIPLRNTPHLTIYIDSCYTYFKLIVTVVHTRKLLYKWSWKYLFNHLECYLILFVES